MSKLSLMIFTLVILTTILCDHSVFSRQRQSPQRFPGICRVYKDNFKHVEKRYAPKAGVVCFCKKDRTCKCRDNAGRVDWCSDYIEFMRKRFPKVNVECVWKKKCKGDKGSSGSLNNAPIPL